MTDQDTSIPALPNARRLMGPWDHHAHDAPRNWPSRAAFDLARLLLADLDLRMSTGDSRELAMARVIRDHSLLAEGLAAYCPICGTEQECPACDSIAHCPTCGEEKGCLKCERVEPVSCPACGTDTVREE